MHFYQGGLEEGLKYVGDENCLFWIFLQSTSWSTLIVHIAMVEARKHTYILEEYLGIGGPDQGVLDMKGVKVMIGTVNILFDDKDRFYT